MPADRISSVESLEYARPYVPPPRVPPTAAELKFRKRVFLGVTGLVLILTCFVATIFVGNSARRVRIQHGGVHLPASTRNLNCGGNSLTLGGGIATATFTIDAADLPSLLSQFRIYTDADDPLYFAGPFKPDGVFNGMNPAGDDRVHLTWHTVDAKVTIELETNSD